MQVDFFKHSIDEQDIQRVNEVLTSTFLTNAHVSQDLEERLAAYLQVEYCVAVSSCTAALHLALLALGVGEGDEVITTPMSFIATSNAILHAGATPIFIDVEKESGNMDVSLIEAAITNKTKAIMPVHLYGNMCDMQNIKKIADKYKLKIIEDAAHAIEAMRDGVRVGELGDMACFSFYATKNITSGEGGAISCKSQALQESLKRLRLHGMSKDAASRHGKTYTHWDMIDLGWKYNITDIQSALLIGQLERIEQQLERRKEIALAYHDAFTQHHITHVWHNNSTKSSYHLFTILVQNRDSVLLALQEKGIGVTVNYNPIHLTHYYKTHFNFHIGLYPNAEAIGNATISIPLYPKMKNEEVNYVIKSVIEVLT